MSINLLDFTWHAVLGVISIFMLGKFNIQNSTRTYKDAMRKENNVKYY